jgi:hypothetical protein
MLGDADSTSKNLIRRHGRKQDEEKTKYILNEGDNTKNNANNDKEKLNKGDNIKNDANNDKDKTKTKYIYFFFTLFILFSILVFLLQRITLLFSH